MHLYLILQFETWTWCWLTHLSCNTFFCTEHWQIISGIYLFCSPSWSVWAESVSLSSNWVRNIYREAIKLLMTHSSAKIPCKTCSQTFYIVILHLNTLLLNFDSTDVLFWVTKLLIYNVLCRNCYSQIWWIIHFIFSWVYYLCFNSPAGVVSHK